MGKYTDGGDVDLDQEIVTRDDGTRITEADAESQAAEVIARNKGGRPSLTGGSTTSPRIALRVSEDLHSRLAARAEHDGKRVSEVVRAALEEYVSG